MCKKGGGANRCNASMASHIKEKYRKRIFYQARKNNMNIQEWRDNNKEKYKTIELAKKEELIKNEIPTSQWVEKRRIAPIPHQTIKKEDINDHYNKIVSKLTDKEFNSLINYSIASYQEINKNLRDNDSLTDYQKEITENLDNIFYEHSYSIPEEANVYRYVELEKDQTPEEWIDQHFSKGIMTDKGFVSTTISPEHALAMSERNRLRAGYKNKRKRYLILEINSEKGLPISSYYGDDSIQSTEQELVLPRNLSFELQSQSTIEHVFAEERPETNNTLVTLENHKASLPMFTIKQI